MRKYRIRVSNMLRRVGRFFRHPIHHMTEVINTAVKWVKDPDLDLVGAGVVGSLVGRSAIYGSFAAASLSAGATFFGGILVGVIAIDILIHAQTLQALRRLMGMDAAAYIFKSFQPTLVTV